MAARIAVWVQDRKSHQVLGAVAFDLASLATSP